MKKMILFSKTYMHDLICIGVLSFILVILSTVGPPIGAEKELAINNADIGLNSGNSENINLANTQQSKAEAKDFVYLSDIPYMTDISYTSYSTIQLDKNLSGGLITVNIDGKQKMFMKGILAHANATVAYDLTKYNYDYLTAYLGVNADRGTIGNGVRFEIHTSDDGKNWTLKEKVNNNAVFKGATDAYFLKYPVKNVKYIKFVIQDCGNNSNDHSVIANAKLISESYQEPVLKVDYIKTVEEYDEIIRTFPSANLTNEQELILLQREFVNNATYDLLQNLATFNSVYNETLSWLMTNLENLKLYVMGGKPEGSYYNAIVQLTRLYSNYKNDFTNTTLLNNKWDSTLTYGDLYKKMAFALSLTHSTTVRLWMQNSKEDQSDAVVRYAIYRFMHKNGRFKATDSVDMTPMFESLPVETMRFIMNNAIDDESILWLNDYVQSKIDATPSSVGSLLTPHPYMAYVWPNYGNSIYYDEANKDYFNELFAVPDRNNPEEKIGLWDLTYTIPGGTDSKEYTLKVTRGTSDYKLYKVWMNFRNKFGTGAVCGGISKSGSNIRTTHGIPATVIGQPGHAALLYYSQNTSGQGYWGIDNDVSGWTLSEKGERMLLGWGNDRKYATGYTVTYMVMAQEALNRFEDYQRSSELLMLANSYKNDPSKYEECLRASIKALDFNVDAWYKLIELYNNDSTKTEEDYFNLVKELSDSFLEYPLPFYQLSALIKPKFTSNAYQFKYSLLVTSTLTKAKNYQGTDVLQPGVTRVEASYLLGLFDSTLATFSFDGNKANKIVLSNRFDGNGIRWDYSLDGKKTWNEVSFTGDEAHELELTAEQIASITAENDIYIHVVGVNYSEENLFKIDIQESLGLPSTLYANDLEDKLIAAVPTMMWKYNENDKWTYYKDAEPDLSGDRDVIVKAGATGLYLASKDSVTYHFTNNVQPNDRKYVKIEHLSIESVSSEATAQGRYARNIIDGNINTNWHSAWNGSDRTKEIVIKLDEPRNITAMDYYPLAGGNGKIEQAQILISMDGENYVEAAVTDWTYKNTADVGVRTIDFEPVRGQYIKIVGKKTQAASASNSFIAGAMFNFYENTAIKVVANFSFDGNNAGKIVLNDADYSKEWKYSIDNGATWKTVSGNNAQLSKEDLSNITAENGIKIKLSGDNTEYSIKIKDADPLELNPYLNDLENRLIAIGDTSKLEWKYSDTNDWTSYSEEEPVVIGNRTLQVRAKATSTTVASNVLEYHFTEDNHPDEEKYISIKHLSISGYSTQSIDSTRPFYAPNVIDGNPNTLWHTDFRYSVLTQSVKPFVTIKLDSPRYISALEFIQKKYKINDPDYIKNVRVYVSLDGDDWTLAGSMENIAQEVEMRKIVFGESIYGQYVKFETDTYGIFASAAMINLYEDISQIAPHVSVEYNITNKTNSSVIATLVSDKDIEVTNNNGSKTYTFDKNGTFIFEYTDHDGNVGTIPASVTWIDKVAPTGTIEYSIRDVTNYDVVVTLVPSENVTVTNNNGSKTYTFTENGEFTFEFVDDAGNEGTATANVTWINKKAPIGTVTYNKTTATNQNVVATLNVENGVAVTNNGGNKNYTFKENGEFTFEFVDKAGNRGTVTAKVNWIDREAPKGTVVYNIETATNKDVEATLITNKKTTITNNNGSDKHIFKENGEFTFEFVDEAGNKGSYTAKVDWINKKAPEGTITYDKNELTNQDVTAILQVQEGVTVTNNNGSKTYTFTKNGEFTFEFVDQVGNKGSVTAKVDWIDKKAPVGTVSYDKQESTSESVKATLSTDEEVTITNNNGSNEYVFTHNGEFTFEFVDKAGNKGSITAKVDWIVNPNLFGKLVYSISTATNQDVVVTLEVNEGIRIINNNGSNKYTFTKNGTFDFEIADDYGNKKVIQAKVDWIDKKAPIGEVHYSLTTPTNGKVIATLETDEEVTITNNNGSSEFIFTENGEFIFKFVDKAGNKGTAVAKVNWINKEAPVGTITYDIKDLTNKDVKATLSTDKKVTITNNNGSNEYTFTKNGKFVFEFIDELGNKGSAVAIVNWIDKKAPVGTITYDVKDLTNKDVKATLSTDEEVTITNNNGSNEYTFTKNGEFTFEFVDKVGNKGSFTAKVDWIDKKAPVGTITYDIQTSTTKNVKATLSTDEKVTITNNNGSNEYIFTKNGEFTFEFVDKAGNKGTVVAIVSWITDATNPEDPSTPEDPILPSEPVKPEKPTNPVEKPTEPVKPTLPNTESTKPVQKEETITNSSNVSSNNTTSSSTTTSSTTTTTTTTTEMNTEGPVQKVELPKEEKKEDKEEVTKKWSLLSIFGWIILFILLCIAFIKVRKRYL